jgi:methylated-DNA-[protein]-cysteine S-methyltransferase
VDIGAILQREFSGARLTEYDAPAFGVGSILVEDTRLVWHESPRPRRRPPASVEPGGERLASRLAAFYAGRAEDFGDVELDLSELTPFGRELCDALRAVPRGEVVTYGELAALAGRPGAARAAGTFCAQNRFPAIVPCHRVVAAGGIGGYGSLGLAYKRRLLELEGVAL